MKDGFSIKNGDFVSDFRYDLFVVFDSFFGDSFNFKGGSLKKKGYRKFSGGKFMVSRSRKVVVCVCSG